MAKPTIQGREIRLQRRADGRLYTQDVEVAPEPPVVGPPPPAPGEPYPAIHDFTGLPLTPDGWTDLLGMFQTPGKYEPENCRIIYVSSSGQSVGGVYAKYHPDIGGDEETQTPGNPFNPVSITPFNDIGTALTYMRDGKADLLLLKRGDTFYRGFGSWELSGLAADQRMMIAAYGTGPKPRIDPYEHGFWLSVGKWNAKVSTPRRFFILADLSVRQSTRDPYHPDLDHSIGTSSLSTNWPWEDLLVENIDITFASFTFQNRGFETRPQSKRIAMRRCSTSMNYPRPSGGHVQGSFVYGITGGFLSEETLYQYGGHHPDAETLGYGGRAGALSHNMYFSSSSQGVIWRRNIAFEPSSQNCKGRPGGIYDNNLLLNGGNNIYCGRNGGSVSYNVVLYGRAHDNTWGPWARVCGDVKMNNNVCAHIHPDAIARDCYRVTNFSYSSRHHGWEKELQTNVNYEGPGRYVVEGNVAYNWGTRLLVIEDFTGEKDAPWPTEPWETELVYDTPWEAYLESLRVANNRLHSEIPGATAARFNGFNGPAEVVAHILSKSTLENNQYYVPGTTPIRFGASLYPFEAWSEFWPDTGSTFGPITFPDPERDILTYMATMNMEGTVNDFVNACLNMMDKETWDWRLTAPAVNTYIRAGFGVAEPE
jgi:hypothetical protein